MFIFINLIGDKESDIEAGICAGVGKNILLASDAVSAENTSASYVATSLEDIYMSL